MRAHDLIGHPAYDATGQSLGRVVDVVTEPDGQGRPRIVAVMVAAGWHGRLLGYERREAGGPWLVERLARLLYRGCREVPWSDLRLQRV